jgi:hypothetical protein
MADEGQNVIWLIRTSPASLVIKGKIKAIPVTSHGGL